MDIGSWIALGVIVLAAVLALIYIVRAKKKGKRCIGCPSDGCSSCAGCRACRQEKDSDDK